VVATGRRATEIARPDELQAFLKSHLSTLREKTAVLTESGTPSLVTVINAKGLLATHNASREVFEHADDIGADALKEQYVVRNTACHGCPVACGKLVKMPPGEYAGRNMKMPEYETIFAMGPMLDNRDLSAIINANGICDLYGMDTISMGVTLAFVAECMERGLVTEQDLGGRVDFEDGPGLVELVRATSRGEGIGALLALGSERLAERFGGDVRKYLYSVKGLEVPGHSARGLRMMSIGYANATRGGSHHDTRADYTQADEDPGFEGQAAYSVRSQNFTAAGDSLVLCRFVEEKGFGTTNNEPIAQVLNAVTGWDMTPDDLDVIGERIVNLERMINVRRGVRRADDVLPHRTMNEPIPDGPAKGRYCPREELDAMLDEYYRLRGWTPEGIPSEQKLAELGLA
jgi:aldehyde:ferredoxin oxidoreductase